MSKETMNAFVSDNRAWIKGSAIMALVALYHGYLAVALLYDFHKATTLLAWTVIAWALAGYYKVVVPLVGAKLKGSLTEESRIKARWGKLTKSLTSRIIIASLVALAIAAFLVWDTMESRNRLRGLLGMAFLIAFMFVFSKSPGKVNWRPVVLGFLVQFVFGMAILRWEYGSRKLGDLSELVIVFLDFSHNGTNFVYGFLSSPPNICGMEPVIAFATLPVLIYCGSVVSLLYHYGIIQAVLKRMAWAMQRTMGTTATESLNACACIFLGMVEAPLLIRPYLDKMTASELHAVMTSGFSCIAGSLFATFISFGACPRYLISGTVMSAPGSLACSKLFCPEIEESQTAKVEDLELPRGDESNALEAISVFT